MVVFQFDPRFSATGSHTALSQQKGIGLGLLVFLIFRVLYYASISCLSLWLVGIMLLDLLQFFF